LITENSLLCFSDSECIFTIVGRQSQLDYVLLYNQSNQTVTIIKHIKTSTGSVQSWPKEYFFVVFEISAADLPCCRGAAESPVDATYEI